MKAGLLVSIVVAVAAVGGMAAVFVGSASPYVTIHDARQDVRRVHVVGKIDQATLANNTLAGEVKFDLKDETGIMKVRYVGPPQSNLEHATQVVVIGSVKGETFEADQMLVKCPSKYESESTASKKA